ncbi:hypothetical protein KY285_026840 [Solanum tuberosum]|nr:hypothetical protein KY289_029278 [Solanum tuberosum]KAH0661927.1 hypothetical protein KY284_026858 [Solanum tuberosum]KAH0665634.1 hypothetical protein KY285_026840 [Solanum tuberosum]
MGDWDNIDDALQMAIMYFIHTFVFSQLGDAAIPIEDFLMVEDNSYQQFLWGQRAFTMLMNSLRQEFKIKKQMYCLNGMPYALNNICPNIQPTAEEITSLDLPHISHVSPIEPAPSNVNPEDGQPKEVPGFEDFSSKPSDQLLRRSTRVSSTRFTPPPKRRKVVRPHKINVPKDIQPDEQLNQTFQTPNLPMSEAGNVSGVPDNSDIRKVIFDNSELEELKQYVKGYDIGGISMSYMVDDSVEKDNVDPQSTFDQFFQQPISPIHMNFSIHDQDIGRSAVDVEKQEQIIEINVAKDDAIDVAPQSDTKGLSGDEHGVDTLQQNCNISQLERSRRKFKIWK